MHAQRFCSFAIAVTLACISSVASADDAPTRIETLIVTADRAPQPASEASAPVEVIHRDALEQRAPIDLAELLVGRPGISVSRSGGIGELAEVRLRGGEANHLQVRIDGVEIDDPATGSSVDFSQILPIGIERVELLRGASSALWGSDALSGILAIDTTPPAEAAQLHVGASAGSFDTTSERASGAYSTDAWHVAAGAQHERTDGTNVALDGHEDDAYRNTTWNVNTGWTGATTELRLVARDVQASVDIDPTPPPDFVPADGPLTQDVSQHMGGVTARWSTAAAWQHTLDATWFESSNTSRDTGVDTGSADGRRVRLGYQADWRYGAALESGVTAAVEYAEETLHQRGPVSPFGDPHQNQSTDATSEIVEWRTALPARASLSLSARHDANDAFRDANAYRAALRVPFDEQGATLYLTWGTGTKNPTFADRFGFTPDTFIGNPNLRPERSESTSATFVAPIGAQFVAQVAVFRDRLTDEIDGFVFDAMLGGFTARNVDGTSRRDGIEPSLVWTPSDQLSVALDYTYLDATEPADGKHEEEVRRPRHTGAARIDWTPTERASVELGAAYVGRHTDFDFSSFPAARKALHDYTLVHCTARYRVTDRFTLELRGENLADAHYEDVIGYRPLGRTVTFGIEGSL